MLRVDAHSNANSTVCGVCPEIGNAIVREVSSLNDAAISKSSERLSYCAGRRGELHYRNDTVTDGLRLLDLDR